MFQVPMQSLKICQVSEPVLLGSTRGLNFHFVEQRNEENFALVGAKEGSLELAPGYAKPRYEEPDPINKVHFVFFFLLEKSSLIIE